MLFRSDPKSYKVMGAILFVEVMMVVSGAFAARGNVKCDYLLPPRDTCRKNPLS